ncbi:MAG: class I SAM-dependent methyltransferase [Thermoleophilaceae bacterium]
MVVHAAKHYGVEAIGATLSRDQAEWGQRTVEETGLSDRAEVRWLDYRDVAEGDFDAISSIGLTEHVGKAQLSSYFDFLLGKLRPQGRLLNHTITRHDNVYPAIPRRSFLNRYVFPDGELLGPGRIASAMHDAGFELRHEENLREHYARTVAAWSANLQDHWEEAVAEVGEGRARVWRLYLAGARVSFEWDTLELHQMLGVRTTNGAAGMPLRPDWEPAAGVADMPAGSSDGSGADAEAAGSGAARQGEPAPTRRPRAPGSRGLRLADEAVVHEGGDHPAHDRTDQVDRQAAELARDDARAERPRGVQRPSGHRARGEDPHHEREPDGKRRDTAVDPRVGRHRDDHEHEDEGHERLHGHSLKEADTARQQGRPEADRSVARDAPERRPGREGARHRPGDLGADVDGNGLEGRLARRGEGDRDRRVDVRAGRVSEGGDDHHQRHAEPERNRQRVVREAGDRLLERRGACDRRPHVDEDPRADELSDPGASEVRPDVPAVEPPATSSGSLSGSIRHLRCTPRCWCPRPGSPAGRPDPGGGACWVPPPERASCSCWARPLACS